MGIFQKSVENNHLAKIDQMVYQLYELTEEEIAIIENSINLKKFNYGYSRTQNKILNK